MLVPQLIIIWWSIMANNAGGWYPANTRYRTNVVLMLGQRRRQWTNIKTTLVQCLCVCWVVRHIAVSFHTGTDILE